MRVQACAAAARRARARRRGTPARACERRLTRQPAAQALPRSVRGGSGCGCASRATRAGPTPPAPRHTHAGERRGGGEGRGCRCRGVRAGAGAWVGAGGRACGWRRTCEERGVTVRGNSRRQKGKAQARHEAGGDAGGCKEGAGRLCGRGRTNLRSERGGAPFRRNPMPGSGWPASRCRRRTCRSWIKAPSQALNSQPNACVEVRRSSTHMCVATAAASAARWMAAPRTCLWLKD